MNTDRALLLIGSPKPKKSTSSSLGKYLSDELERLGMRTDTLVIHRHLGNPEKIGNMMSSIERSRLLVFIFPLYIDCLPYPVVRAFELIYGDPKPMEGRKRKEMAAVMNCGFPEHSQCSAAMRMCELFSEKAGMKWLGGLSLGEGGFIHGKPLARLGGKVRNVKNSLVLSAEALAGGEPLPERAVELMGKYMIPRWMYTSMGTMGWKSAAGKNGVKARLYDRPYQKER